MYGIRWKGTGYGIKNNQKTITVMLYYVQKQVQREYNITCNIIRLKFHSNREQVQKWKEI